MGEDEFKDFGSFTKGLGGLPDPAKTTFIAAASRILGGVAAFPAALLRRPVQKIEDITNARSLVSQGLARARVEKMKGDPVIMQAAAESYLPEVIRKTANKARTIQIASEEYAAAGGSRLTASLDDDWINKFIRFSEDASSERLQFLFGKILAGELINPGTFSPSTLRAVSELTQTIAEDFTWAWGKNIEDEIWRGPEFGSGEPWMRLTRLRDAGFLSPIDSAIHQPRFNPIGGVLLWSIGRFDDASLSVAMTKVANVRLNVVIFSSIGMELGSLLARPNFEANLRQVAAGFPKNGVAWIWLLRGGRMVEVLWSRP